MKVVILSLAVLVLSACGREGDTSKTVSNSRAQASSNGDCGMVDGVYRQNGEKWAVDCNTASCKNGRVKTTEMMCGG